MLTALHINSTQIVADIPNSAENADSTVLSLWPITLLYLCKLYLTHLTAIAKDRFRTNESESHTNYSEVYKNFICLLLIQFLTTEYQYPVIPHNNFKLTINTYYTIIYS